MKQISFLPTFVSWQKAARRALREEISPNEIAWEEIGEDQPGLHLFEEAETEASAKPAPEFRVPKRFLALAKLVALHRQPTRWPLLYRLLWRLTHGESHLLEISIDPDVAQANDFEKSVRHDLHKMRAFVRFREIEHAGGKWYVAWFEPEHHIVEENAPFFADRFAAMRWSILTPDRCAHWDGKNLTFTAGVSRAEAPDADAMEELWRTYYANIFNPARVKVHAMQAEMPKKYWRNLPEATLIPSLLHDAPRRVETMMKKSAAKIAAQDGDEWRPAPAPETSSLTTLREAAAHCTACPLYKNATQTVFGEGRKGAALMLLGEQPGDQEDLTGKPFIGPAGQLLNRALEEAGIDRDAVYVTNTVKHFKWEPRGKRRIHQKPSSRDIAACRPWLEAELRVV
ncbi:MAG TPA: TIGR03915 family putative DNA repair protein, partial [Chthoniobacterales bacterium]|nr:TIGR03915 family putative DNA repair protein [Chthoniobacterales bacterium]